MNEMPGRRFLLFVCFVVLCTMYNDSICLFVLFPSQVNVLLISIVIAYSWCYAFITLYLCAFGGLFCYAILIVTFILSALTLTLLHGLLLTFSGDMTNHVVAQLCTELAVKNVAKFLYFKTMVDDIE